MKKKEIRVIVVLILFFSFWITSKAEAKTPQMIEEIASLKTEVIGLKERTAKLEGIVFQMNERLGSIEARLNHFEIRLNHFETRLNSIEAKIDSNFKWLLGTILGTWITLMLALVSFMITFIRKR